MNHFFLIVLSFIIYGCSSVPKTILTFYVEGADEKAETTVSIKDHISIGQNDERIGMALFCKDSAYVIKLDSTSSATIVLNEDFQSGYATLNYAGVSIPMYIEPEKDIDVALKITGHKLTPYFTGEGAPKNDYLNSRIFFYSSPADFKLDINTFLMRERERERKLISYLDSMGFEDEFNQPERVRIYAFVYHSLLLYPHYSIEQENQELPQRYYERLKTAMVENEVLLNCLPYCNFISEAVERMVQKERTIQDPLTLLRSKLNYLQQEFSNPMIQEYFIDKFLTTYVNNKGVDDLSEFLPLYEEKVTSPTRKAKFHELCNSLKNNRNALKDITQRTVTEHDESVL